MRLCNVDEVPPFYFYSYVDEYDFPLLEAFLHLLRFRR